MKGLEIRLLRDGVGTPKSVHPVFGDDIKINITKDDEQIFSREKIDGTFKFVREDFDILYESSMYTKFTLEIYRGDMFVSSGEFMRTDCEFNLDDKIASVKVSTTDIYDKILNSYDNKYNLVKLAPIIESVKMQKRAILQLYVSGENKITNIVGGMYFEESCKEVLDVDTLRNTYRFGVGVPISYIVIASLNPQYYDVSIEIMGRYKISGTGRWGGITFVHTTQPRYHFDIVTWGSAFSSEATAILYDGDEQISICNASLNLFTKGETSITFQRVRSGQTQNVAYGRFVNDGVVFGRVLLPYKHSGAFDRTREDITDYDSNYPYIGTIGLSFIAGKVNIQDSKSSSPTEWGLSSDGSYFMYPYLDYQQKKDGIKPVPFGQSHWERMSSWFFVDSEARAELNKFNDIFTLKDAFPLWSAIDVLLKKIAPDISFDKTAQYSSFLFDMSSDLMGTYPFPSGRKASLYISPISNVKKTYYDQAAQRGDISLKQILDMLRKVYRAYWFIDSNKRLRIEHILYFKNGNTYDKQSAIPKIDLTTMQCLPPKESWEYGQHSIKYDVSKCPIRYEFKWAEDSTEPFNGFPIDISDNYLKSNKKESISVENFVSDIDLTIIKGKDMNDNLYSVFEVDSTKRLTMSEVRLSGESPIYEMQNAFMSFLAAEKLYYPYDLSGWNAVADGVSIDVFRSKDIVKQDISFPITIEKIGELGVIRTELGDGIASKLDITADTLYSKATIRYESERDYTNEVYIYSEGATRRSIRNPTLVSLMVEVEFVLNGLVSRVEKYNIPMRTTYKITIQEGEVARVVRAAEYNTPFAIERYFYNPSGKMTFDDRRTTGLQYVLEINGNKYNKGDFAGIRIIANRRLEVRIEASTEYSYDGGYIEKTPYINTDNEKPSSWVSGSGTKTTEVNAGESFYIGYTKDFSQVSNDDKITITIIAL